MGKKPWDLTYDFLFIINSLLNKLIIIPRSSFYWPTDYLVWMWWIIMIGWWRLYYWLSIISFTITLSLGNIGREKLSAVVIMYFHYAFWNYSLLKWEISEWFYSYYSSLNIVFYSIVWIDHDVIILNGLSMQRDIIQFDHAAMISLGIFVDLIIYL